MYAEPSLFGDVSAARRAIINARIEIEKQKLRGVRCEALRELLVAYGLADTIHDTRKADWTKREMIFEIALLRADGDSVAGASDAPRKTA